MTIKDNVVLIYLIISIVCLIGVVKLFTDIQTTLKMSEELFGRNN